MTMRLSFLLAGSWLITFAVAYLFQWGATWFSLARQKWLGYGLLISLASMASDLLLPTTLANNESDSDHGGGRCLRVGDYLGGCAVSRGRASPSATAAWRLRWLPLGSLVAIMGYDLWHVTKPIQMT